MQLSLRADDLNSFLLKLGLDVEDKTNIPQLTMSARALMTAFQRQMYIRVFKETIGETSRQMVEWGFRAEQEVDKMDVLKFVSSVYKCEPKDWRENYAVLTDGASVSEAEAATV